MATYVSRRGKAPASPPAVNENVRNTMRANRGRDTGPERLLRTGLARAGVRGYRLNAPGVGGRPDVTFTRLKLAVFVHGCFWHRCPHCSPPVPKRHREFWVDKFERNQERDARKRRDLRRDGWRVIEVWECRLEADPEREVRRVLSALRVLRSAR